MKITSTLKSFGLALLGGIAALGIQKNIFKESQNNEAPKIELINSLSNQDQKNVTTNSLQKENQPINISQKYTIASNSGMDFTTAAEKSVNAVVHVKNVSVYRRPQNYMDLFFNNGTGSGKLEKAIVGAGSGVIISADGYIVTNNHVIDGASELQVTLNNNKSYKATIIGTAPDTDIALIKINTEDELLEYLPFGNSDNTKIGEWVLAIGNPFNLTSTVTAGIISAKARDLNEEDRNIQSYIQTDAAINPGNSGGALVNTHGELIGINTAISSQTGSYVGYGFAVTSNVAKKIVADLLEYGSVQKAILGISGTTFTEAIANELKIDFNQGVYVSHVSKESGADQSGIKQGDVIIKIDEQEIRKFSDLTGYISSKRPNDQLSVRVLRNNKAIDLVVKLKLFDSYIIKKVGLEVIEATPQDLKRFDTNYGVKINKALSKNLRSYGVEGILITEIDDKKVTSVADVRKILSQKTNNEDIVITFLDRDQQKKHFVFNQ